MVGTDVCVVGGGPAGMMLAVLLLREGLTVTVLEKHADFLRDFRGDTIHGSTLNLMDVSGWARRSSSASPTAGSAACPGVFGGTEYQVADCTRLPGRHQYIALMPQWDFLDFLAGKAGGVPRIHSSARRRVNGLVRENARVAGVTAQGPDGPVEVRARLTVACDGRSSDVRRLLGMRSRVRGADGRAVVPAAPGV